MTPTALQTEDPKRIGRYRLLGRLGGGGMGVVYLGEAPGRRPVAIKVVRSEYADDPAFRMRFRREVETASQVTGACTVRVLDADVDSPRPYLVTEYVPGPTLSAYVEEHGPLRGSQLTALALALAEALAAIHRAGVVHRDLKPSNVLLTPEGPRVIDFGIARAADATAITRTGGRVGTPAWMAPEQVGGGTVGSPADVFGWGALVTFASTGRPPFAGETSEAVQHRLVNEDPDLEGLHEPLRRVVARALAKRPADRPTPIQLLRHLLEDETVADEDSDAGDRVTEVLDRAWVLEPEDPAASYRTRWRRGRRLRSVLWAAMVAGLLSGGLVGGWMLAGGTEGPPRARPTPAGDISPSPESTPTGSPVLAEQPPDPDDPGSYYTTDGTKPSLFPSCNGAFGLCLGSPLDQALTMFGTEDQRYGGPDPGSITRQWGFDGVLLTVDADDIESIRAITVAIGEKPKAGLRIALRSGWPHEPTRLLLGPLTMGDVIQRLGEPYDTASFSAENTWFYTYVYRAGPEGTHVLEFTHASFGDEVGFGPDLDRRLVTSFHVRYG